MTIRYKIFLLTALVSYPMPLMASTSIIDINTDSLARILSNQTDNLTLSVNNNICDPNDAKVLDLRAIARKDMQSGVKSRITFSSPIDFHRGYQYRISLWAKCSNSGTMRINIKQNRSPWRSVGTQSDSEKVYDIANKWKHCILFFNATRDWKNSEVSMRISLSNEQVGTIFQIGSISFEELSEYKTLDLKSVANFSFSDENANDGKGGWSDQGAGNDFSKFPYEMRWFSQIPFDVICPSENNGKSILSFDCEHVKNGLKRVEIKVSSDAAKFKKLYLLHASAWTPSAEKLLGQIRFTGNYGNQTVDVVTGRDVADWWNPRHDIPNAIVAFEVSNPVAKIGAYVSSFNVPAGTEKIIFESSGLSAWMIVAATLADFDAVATPQDIEVISANNKWKPIDISSLYIKPGTALDFSNSAFPAPSGINGRVIANSKGVFAFADKPEESIRFQGYGVLPRGLIWWPELLDKTDLDAYADAVKRQGYNLIRLHMVEEMLFYDKDIMPHEGKFYDRPDEIPFKPENVDYFNYLIYCLKKRGIYLALDVFGSKKGYTGTNLYSKSQKYQGFRERMYYDDKYRNNWRAGVIRLLTMDNPYTKCCLAKDPVVAFIHLNNEQHLTWQSRDMRGLNPKWNIWVRNKYKDSRVLAKAWPEAHLPSQDAMEHIPPISKELAIKKGAMADDMNRFVTETEIELNDWYENIVRHCGYEGLINNWNNTSPMMRVPPRAMLQVISQNMYFTYPTNYNHPGSIVSQNSTIGITWDYTGMMRFLDRPFIPTEYAAPPFWSRYRHEQGIHFGSYAALQDWSGLCLHAAAVLKRPLPIEPFFTARDPIIRAAEVYTHFAYGRRYVSSAKHSIAYPVHDKSIYSGNAQDGFDLIFGQLFYITKTGIIYLGNNNKSVASIKADLEISPKGGAILTDHEFHETVAAGGKSSVSQRTIDNIVTQMKRMKLLDSSNKCMPGNGIYQSDTDEIIKNAKNETMTVITPRLEAAVIKKDQPVTLNKIIIIACTPQASVAMITLDETRTLSRSLHLLLIFNTDALNSDMSYASKHRNKLINKGTLPVLMETGKLSVSMETSVLTTPKVYSLKLDGTRADNVAVKIQNGRMILEVDTAALPSGPTPFFEIVQD